MVITMNTINAASTAAIQNQERSGASQATDLNKKAETQAIANKAVSDVNGVESVEAIAGKEQISKVVKESQADDEQQVLEEVASNLQNFVNLIDKELNSGSLKVIKYRLINNTMIIIMAIILIVPIAVDLYIFLPRSIFLSESF